MSVRFDIVSMIEDVLDLEVNVVFGFALVVRDVTQGAVDFEVVHVLLHQPRCAHTMPPSLRMQVYFGAMDVQHLRNRNQAPLQDLIKAFRQPSLSTMPCDQQVFVSPLKIATQD